MQADDNPNHASITAELEAARHELARAVMERDFALRLVRRQQYLNAGYPWNAEQSPFLIRILRRIPKNITNVVPMRFKRLLKRVILWAR